MGWVMHQPVFTSSKKKIENSSLTWYFSSNSGQVSGPEPIFPYPFFHVY